MNVVVAGVVVRWEPSGYVVVGWHRHDRLVQQGETDDVYEHLALDEVWDVIGGHLNANLPGRDCYCTGWSQQQLFG